MQTATQITSLIGNTPLVEIPNGNGGKLLAKLENQNPGGSVKDRLAWAMVLYGEQNGHIGPDTVIIEPTSGNTGVGLAMVCASRGYKLIITMPASMSAERQGLIRAYGAEILLTPPEEGINGAINKARGLQAEHPDSYIPFQFSNPANARMHFATTGPEIWEATGGQVDVFVAGVGTGGTVTGTGEYLKSCKTGVQIAAVEPDASAVLSGGKPGKHAIQGIGAGFVPDVLKTQVLDEVVRVTDQDAFSAARELATHYGVLAGISSGANFYAARQIAQRPENHKKTIVFIVCDTGERYLSTSLFSGI